MRVQARLRIIYAGPVRRQAVGVIILLLAGLLVAVIPALKPTLITGSATAAPIPGAPSVGDCVTDPIPYSSLLIGLRGPGGEYVYPALMITACDGPRYGEVTAVVPIASTPTVTVSGSTTTTTDSNVDKCWAASAAYVGTAPATDPSGSLWSPTIWAPSSVSRPLPAAQAAGQQWLACLTYVQSADQFPDRTAAPYTGTLRSAASTGYQGDQLGLCGFSPGQRAVGACTKPHQYQQLASGSTQTTTLSRAELNRTCTESANLIIGRPDATDGGNLEVVVTVFGSDGNQLEVGDVPPDAYLMCGNRRYWRPLTRRQRYRTRRAANSLGLALAQRTWQRGVHSCGHHFIITIVVHDKPCSCCGC